MSRNKKVLQKVTIEDIGAKGKAIARVNDLVVFVKGAIPGDVADIKVIRKKKKYLEGKPIHFHQFSEKRIPPFCSHFNTCGGCTWQNLSYEDQLIYKQKEVRDNLERVGKVDTSSMANILPAPSTRYYRNKLEFTFSNKRWLTREEVASKGDIPQREMNGLGFHMPRRFDKVVDIDHCYHQPDPSNAIRLFVKRFALENGLSFFDIVEQKGMLRNLIIRTTTTQETMVIVVFAKDDQEKREMLLDALQKEFPTISSLMYAINPKKNDALDNIPIKPYQGKDHILERMGDLQFKIGPKSFFQTNTEQAIRLYEKVKEFAGLSGKETVFDLYTGTGTIANYLAPSAGKVIGIESIPEAVEHAKENSQLNNITNTAFYAGDMKDLIHTPEIKALGDPEVLVTDPPRSGMHKDVVGRILEMAPHKIVYVSCNPGTQARDLEAMKDVYEVKAIQPVDMFPHTYHVENIVLLAKRS